MAPDQPAQRTRRPDEVRKILHELKRGLKEIYGDRLRGLYVYGSYARREARPGSDLDVLVVLDEVESTWEEIKRTGQLVSEISLANDVSVSRIFLSESAWLTGDTPFTWNMREEAVPA